LAQGRVGSRLHVALNERRLHRKPASCSTSNGTSWAGPVVVASGADLRGVDVAGFHGVPIVSWVDLGVGAADAGSIRVAAVEIPEPGAVASAAATLFGLAISLRLLRVGPACGRFEA
jgi:hypothetical protein